MGENVRLSGFTAADKSKIKGKMVPFSNGFQLRR